MSKKTVDQHEVLNRWREIADELAAALAVHSHPVRCGRHQPYRCDEALRRYEEARGA